MSGLVRVRVRQARAADFGARAGVVRAALRDHFASAWLLFFFQEVTLQAVVLVGAVLFIFVGLSPWQCAALVPAAALAVAAAVAVQHEAHADALAQGMRAEDAGFVAEASGALAAELPPPVLAAISLLDGDAAAADDDHCYWQIVGTVSVSGCDSWSGGYGYEGGYEGGYGGGLGGSGGRVHALGVAKRWRRRGLAQALLAAARGWAEARGWPRLHARLSQIQDGARALLSRGGWACRAAGATPLLHGAVSLHVAHFTINLHHHSNTPFASHTH